MAGPDGTPLLTVSRHVGPPAGGGAAMVVVTAVGQVDLETVELLRLALLDAVDGSRPVCCDLAGVEFFGAAGANALVAAHNLATETGCRFAISGARDTVRRVLRITGLDDLLVGC
ncbi:MAG TPA: STAS domain-containing protein [Catenuloplanes sp.]